MLSQLKAKIYLAEDRGKTENESFRNLSTFNFDHYQIEHRQAFHGLTVCNDEVLGEDRTLSYKVDRDTTVILLPVSGNLIFRFGENEGEILHPGQCLVKSVLNAGNMEISNPYSDLLINYLQLRIKNHTGVYDNSVVDFSLDEAGQLCRLTDHDYKISIAKFTGRQEIDYVLAEASQAVFCFVIEGAFEVANRLIQPRDALALWEGEFFEVEALSDNAIILFIELPLSENIG